MRMNYKHKVSNLFLEIIKTFYLKLDSKQASIWAISIFLLVIIGLAIGGIGCEIMQWSGNQFRTLVKQVSVYIFQ